MERDLVVCCDGTWNGPNVELVTNVRKLFRALEQDERQRCYYQSGVGTSANPQSWLFGGATGAGIERDILGGYTWLARHYRPGDRVWLFGFSRGAHTARRIAGMIGACGILDARGQRPSEWAGLYRRIEKEYARYRTRQRDPARSYSPDRNADDFPVHFVGVWDTVGALGIPDYLGPLKLFDRPQRHQFHDVRLHPGVRHGRHCLALDETRAPFTPTLWEGENDERIKQVWFAGSHVDVGGGYAQDGLSAVSLSWMIQEATEAGLRFRPAIVEAIEERASSLDVLHDDDRAALAPLGPGFMLLKPVLDYFFSPRPRNVPALETRDVHSSSEPLGRVHESVFQRREAALPAADAYRPHVHIEPGASHTVRVWAQREWNPTGLYLRPGRYTFATDGVWRDASDHWSGPEGERWGTWRHRFFSALGQLELALNELGSTIPDDLRARLPGPLRVLLASRTQGIGHTPWTRRVEQAPWMSLVGVVANGRIHGRRYLEHQTFVIGDGTNVAVEVNEPGYLYCFANHAWSAYQDNWGEVSLTVRREETWGERAEPVDAAFEAPTHGTDGSTVHA